MPATLDDTETQLVAGLARDVLARTAPEELALFPITSAAYFRDPAKVTAPRAHGDAALGFGAESVAALAPVALVLSTEAVRWLVGELRKAVQDEGASVVQQLIRRALKRPDAPAAPPVVPIPSAHFATMRQRLVARAIELGVPRAKAEMMADTAVSSLATAGT